MKIVKLRKLKLRNEKRFNSKCAGRGAPSAAKKRLALTGAKVAGCTQCKRAWSRHGVWCPKVMEAARKLIPT